MSDTFDLVGEFEDLDLEADAVREQNQPFGLLDELFEAIAVEPRLGSAEFELQGRKRYSLRLRLSLTDGELANVSKLMKAVEVIHDETKKIRKRVEVSAAVVAMVCEAILFDGMPIESPKGGPITFRHRELWGRADVSSASACALKFIGADFIAGLFDQFDEARQGWSPEEADPQP